LGVAPTKKQREPSEEVRVGFLARLGALESEYKGNELLIELASRFSADDGIDFRVMGRGSEADARKFRAAGMSVALNASDAEREAFFADIDVFFSPSQWEGFNLPLVEAQQAGCASMAFDVGAHPETTPYVMRDMNDVEILLRHWVDDRTALFAAGQRCQRFVSSKFSWDSTALKIAALLDELSPVSYRGPVLWRRIRNVLRAEGIGGTLKKVMRKVVSARK
jgi:glycosyltransferase involved in cell wall biosynthesis